MIKPPLIKTAKSKVYCLDKSWNVNNNPRLPKTRNSKHKTLMDLKDAISSIQLNIGSPLPITILQHFS